MRWFIAPILALTLAAPASAGTVTTWRGETSQPFQTWADRSLMPTPAAVVVIVSRCPPETVGPVPDSSFVAGCTSPGNPIYVTPQRPRLMQRPFLHELGHQFDYTLMSVPERWEFMRLSGSRPWEGIAHERFAEAYATCAMHRTIRRAYEGDYGYRVTPKLHRRTCALIARSADADGDGSGPVADR